MFKVGDKVMSEYGSGTILVIEDDELIGVRHDRPRGFFHSLDGNCEVGRGYWYLIGSVSKTKPTFKGNK